ncbi:MAG: Mrp/NBP35 family ATP-binding protein [Opitutaceae bacterium]|nr:Mrp/NBP35 family ATP-binding protein [Opitutaceae bacterium]
MHCTTEKPPPPIDPTKNAATQMADEALLQARMLAIRQRLFVLSGKGGVGKSTVAVNLAIALARHGRRVGLLDVDVHGPSIPTLLRVPDGRIRVQGNTMLPVEGGPGLKLMSIGYLTTSGSDAIVWRGPRKHSVIRQFLSDVRWGELDYLVVDCPPGTGDEPLAVVQLAGEPAAAVVVTTPQEVAVADVRRCLTFCHQVDLPIAGLVENMSGFVCPHCGHAVDLFGAGGGESLAREAGVPLLGRIPFDPAVVAGGDAGSPFAMLDADTPTTRAFHGIVDRLLGIEVS